MPDISVATFAQLNSAIQTADADTTSGDSYVITLTASITYSADLSAVNLHSGVALTIAGAGFTLDGDYNYRGVTAYAGPLTLSDLTITHGEAVGGTGGEVVGER